MDTTLISLFARETTDSAYAVATSKNIFTGEYSADSVIVTLSNALALYNFMEMILLITTTFKRWKGLYFWSLTLCNWGVMLYALGIILMYFELCVLWLSKVILDIGWASMIVCQSLVLYSRLNLIFNDNRIFLAVKWMIIGVAFCVLMPVIVIDFGTTYGASPRWAQGYYYIEQIQLTVVTFQELSISGLYVWKTAQFLKVLDKKATRSMVWQLFTINIIIIIMDVAIVVLQYRHFQLYQETLKGFVYSVKLKLELNILSKLVDLVHGDTSKRSMTLEVIDSDTIAGQERASIQQEQQDEKARMRSASTMSWYGGEKGSLTAIQEKDYAADLGGKLRPLPAVISREVNGSTSGSGSGGGRSSTDDIESMDEISPVWSNSGHSYASARTRNRRESDIMYAEMMRGMK